MNSDSIRKQLKNLDLKKIKLENGKTIEEELKKHASILSDCLMAELDKIYESYDPKIYERTYNLYNSLDIDRTVKIDISSAGASFSIGLHFDDGAMHQSLDGKMVNTAWLINDGWQTHGRFAHIPNFGFREATYWIEKGIERYIHSVKNPFIVELTKGKEFVRRN